MEISPSLKGIVFLANWHGSKVAVKMVKGAIQGIELEEFKSEATLMKKLHPHPNVVQFLGVCAKDNHLCLVTEFCEGGSLYDLLHSNQPITKESIKKIINGIASGMMHLHYENVIHRDLAARNILLGSNFSPKVSDFGLSRVADSKDERQTNSLVGPLKHMAPECLRSRKYSEKSDVWAFGVTLFEVYTRKDPYPGVSPIEVATGVAQNVNPLRLSVPEEPLRMSAEMTQLYLSCFNTDPEARPTMQEIVTQLEIMNDNLFSD